MKLTNDQKWLIANLYCKDYAIDEIAQELNVSTKAVIAFIKTNTFDDIVCVIIDMLDKNFKTKNAIIDGILQEITA